MIKINVLYSYDQLRWRQAIRDAAARIAEYKLRIAKLRCAIRHFQECVYNDTKWPSKRATGN